MIGLLDIVQANLALYSLFVIIAIATNRNKRVVSFMYLRFLENYKFNEKVSELFL